MASGRRRPIYEYEYDDAPRSWGLAKLLLSCSALIFVAVFTLTSWPAIRPYLHLPAAATPGVTTVFATATPAPAARPTLRPIQNAGGSYNSQVAADSAYATAVAVQQAAPVPNQNATGDTSPIIYAEKPAADRQPAGDNVPTSEPLPAVTDQFGSRSVDPPVDIQATHQCKHGQVWRDGAGCKNP